jgi:hypothetical protein
MGARVIPIADAAWLETFRRHLRESDLMYLTQPDSARYFSASENTLSARLRALGTGWQREVARERKRRFDVATDGGAIRSGPYYATLCGFYETNSFYRAFQQWYGMAFTDWRALQEYLHDEHAGATSELAQKSVGTR